MHQTNKEMGSHIANLTRNWLMADHYFHPDIYDSKIKKGQCGNIRIRPKTGEPLASDSLGNINIIQIVTSHANTLTNKSSYTSSLLAFPLL